MISKDVIYAPSLAWTSDSDLAPRENMSSLREAGKQQSCMQGRRYCFLSTCFAYAEMAVVTV